MQTETIANGTLQTWTPQEVADAYSKGEIVLIDVRTPAEYMFEHVDGAMLAPMSFVKVENIPNKFSTIAHMEGGFGGWKAAGLPFIGTNMATGAPEPRGG